MTDQFSSDALVFFGATGDLAKRKLFRLLFLSLRPLLRVQDPGLLSRGSGGSLFLQLA